MSWKKFMYLYAVSFCFASSGAFFLETSYTACFIANLCGVVCLEQYVKFRKAEDAQDED